MPLPTQTGTPLYWHDGQPIVIIKKGAASLGTPNYWHDGQPIYANVSASPGPPSTGDSAELINYYHKILLRQ